jgi:sec1 family domain-containing protein 1
LDSADFFWKKNAPNPFPQVAEGTAVVCLGSRVDIDAELSRYKQDATRLTQQTGVSSVEEVGNLYVPATACITNVAI